MQQAYTICMVVGIAIPLLSLILGQLFDFMDGIFDGFDFSIDLGDASIPLLPASLQSLCAGVLVFGTLGKLLFTGGNYLFANIIAGAGGYLAALAMQMLINRLKKVKHEPPTRDELQFCETRVTNKIIKNGYGAVSIRTDHGTLSYPARAFEPGAEIPQETLVDIIRFDGGVAIVKPSTYTDRFPSIFKQD